MPKTKLAESVLHDWVHTLPFQMQALLMTGMRGPDTIAKHTPAKAIVRYLRGVVLKPAGEWNGENNNDFMWGDYKQWAIHVTGFFLDHDIYPHHFIMHLIHCAEVIGHKHPDRPTAGVWLHFYHEACHSFHMQPETEEQLDQRLNDFGEGIHNFANGKEVPI